MTTAPLPPRRHHDRNPQMNAFAQTIKSLDGTRGWLRQVQAFVKEKLAASLEGQIRPARAVARHAPSPSRLCFSRTLPPLLPQSSPAPPKPKLKPNTATLTSGGHVLDAYSAPLWYDPSVAAVSTSTSTSDAPPSQLLPGGGPPRPPEALASIVGEVVRTTTTTLSEQGASLRAALQHELLLPLTVWFEALAQASNRFGRVAGLHAQLGRQQARVERRAARARRLLQRGQGQQQQHHEHGDDDEEDAELEEERQLQQHYGVGGDAVRAAEALLRPLIAEAEAAESALARELAWLVATAPRVRILLAHVLLRLRDAAKRAVVGSGGGGGEASMLPPGLFLPFPEDFAAAARGAEARGAPTAPEAAGSSSPPRQPKLRALASPPLARELDEAAVMVEGGAGGGGGRERGEGRVGGGSGMAAPSPAPGPPAVPLPPPFVPFASSTPRRHHHPQPFLAARPPSPRPAVTAAPPPSSPSAAASPFAAFAAAAPPQETIPLASPDLRGASERRFASGELALTPPAEEDGGGAGGAGGESSQQLLERRPFSPPPPPPQPHPQPSIPEEGEKLREELASLASSPAELERAAERTSRRRAAELERQLRAARLEAVAGAAARASRAASAASVRCAEAHRLRHERAAAMRGVEGGGEGRAVAAEGAEAARGRARGAAREGGAGCFPADAGPPCAGGGSGGSGGLTTTTTGPMARGAAGSSPSPPSPHPAFRGARAAALAPTAEEAIALAPAAALTSPPPPEVEPAPPPSLPEEEQGPLATRRGSTAAGGGFAGRLRHPLLRA
jgi:hypothetical protein